ncbi:hypothetical protein D6D10_05437 [Aureobasidium pullulans]|uniref:Uncharacterized protein n=1 Tax=Aureobasidium pullulans TaxID=5580 RepID=A0A4S9ETT7_AURPU|nr:hypothetical protein D6D10_05437 [Aureobasidium pullulans]
MTNNDNLIALGAPDRGKATSSCVHDLSSAVSSKASSRPYRLQDRIPCIATFFNAHGDREALVSLGLDCDAVFSKTFDVQPMAKQLRPKGKVAGKGTGGQYKLIEASEEFGLRMTTQRELQARYPGDTPRDDRVPVQHCAVDDATSTVLLTVKLLEDAAEVHGLNSLEETGPPKSVWPPNGPNIRIVSIDTESCVMPEDMNPVRGYKYAQYISELGGAFIDTDTIRAHPDDWQHHITTFHAVVAEHWDHHPNLRCQESMKIDHTQAYYPRDNASSGPSGCLQQLKTFLVNGKKFAALMSPDSEIIAHDHCSSWLLEKIDQPGV